MKCIQNKKVGNWPTQRPMHRKPFFNATPRFGGMGGVRGSGVVHRETPPYLLQFVCWNRNAIFHRVGANRNKKFSWGDRPQFREMGGVRGSSVIPRESI